MPPPAPELRASLVDCAKKLPTRPLFVLVPGFDTDKLPWGLHIDAINAMRMGLRRGRTTAAEVTAPFNALAFVAGDKAHTVFSDALAPIDVWTARPDGHYVATVQHLGASYAGASIPYSLRVPWVSVFDTSTLTASMLPLPSGSEELSPQSIALEVVDAELFLLERILFVRTAGKDVEVARGKSKLHAVWLDEDRLLFDEEPAPTARWNAVYVAPTAPTREELLASGPGSAGFYVEQRAREIMTERVMKAQLDALEVLTPKTHPSELQVETAPGRSARLIGGGQLQVVTADR